MNAVLSFLLKQLLSLLMDNKEVIKQMLWDLCIKIVKEQRAKAKSN